MDVKNNILETIGNTPLVRLNKITRELPCEVYAKVESFLQAVKVVKTSSDSTGKKRLFSCIGVILVFRLLMGDRLLPTNKV